MASLELLHLEQRFRLRVEHEQTGLPLPPRHEILASQPATTAAVVPSLFTLQQGAPAVKATNQWIQNPILAPSPGHSALLPGLAGIIPNATFPGANANLNLQNSQLLLAAGQLLLQNQNPSERFVQYNFIFVEIASQNQISDIFFSFIYFVNCFPATELRLAIHHHHQQQPLFRF